MQTKRNISSLQSSWWLDWNHVKHELVSWNTGLNGNDPQHNSTNEDRSHRFVKFNNLTILLFYIIQFSNQKVHSILLFSYNQNAILIWQRINII